MMEQMKVYTPTDVIRKKHTPIPLTGEWAEAFGNPEKGDTWFILGKSASGKSTFVMQLAKELCKHGRVLYMSLEEGTNRSFSERLQRLGMREVQGKFRVITNSSIEDLSILLKKQRSGDYVIIDSFQFTGWTYEEAKYIVDSFPRKTFIFISQEYKGRPMGKPADRLKYLAGVKITTQGFRAYCQGRYSGDNAVYYTIWAEGATKVWGGEI